MGKVKVIKPTTEQFDEAMGRILREARMRANMSQAEMAERIGVHLNTVSNYERGKGIQTALFLRICMELGEKPADLLLNELEKAGY
jgi:transcriptional regulator with XRE-family HTH domain